jgi:hypothetical protein
MSMSFFSQWKHFKSFNYYVKSIKTTLAIGFIALSILPINAENIPLISEEISIAKAGKKIFEFGAVPQRNTTVLLEITARINSKKMSGSTAVLKIIINGQEVKAAKTRHAIRLVNKSFISKLTITNKTGPWFFNGRAWRRGWRLIYAPDFEAGHKVPFYEGDPYTLLIDITDLIDPTADNRVELVNLSTNKPFWRSINELTIKRLNIRTKRGVSPMMVSVANIKPIINRGRPAAGPAKYRGKIMPGGGFVINTDKRQWKFASAFSYPNAGLNHLLPSEEIKGQAAWKVSVKLRKDGGDVFANSPFYRLHRSICFTARKVEIKDKLTNLRHKPLGLLVSHEVDLKGINTSVRLAGNPNSATKYHSAANPSTHISLPGQGIGILCEDDVFRSQVQMFAESSSAGIRTEMLRLGPGKTYTLEWSVYPVDGPDYFDFINLVRQDWGANFTVDGAWTIFNPEWILAKPIEKLREMFAHHGIKYAASNGEWRIGKVPNRRQAFGLGVMNEMWADHRSMLRKAAARIREAAPWVNILVYFDSRRDSSKGSHERFRDSWLTNAKGNQLSTNWGSPGNNCYTMLPMLKNSYGRAILKAVDYYIDETGSDGLYWDEMNGGGSDGGFGKIGKTYNIFDGNSCLLDMKNYTIKREVGIPNLLIAPYLLAVINHVHSRGGPPVIGNGAPATRALLATGMPRMIETQHNDYWCYAANLASPMGYTYCSSSTFAGTTRTLRMGLLPWGVPLSSKHEISRYLFPFTPIELHHAYLLGKERIITLHDGNYGWVGKRCLVQLRHFNKKGRLVNDDAFTLIGKEARTAVKLANKEEAMVLVRLPMSFVPGADVDSKWQAKVNKVDYNKSYISLYLEALEGGVLKIKNGKFALQNGKTVKVTLGNKMQQVKIANDCLIINIPAKFSESVEIANANLIENVKAAQNGAKKFKQKIETVDIDGEKVFVVNKNGTYTLNKIKVKAGKKYAISVKLKQLEGKNSSVLIGFIPYTAGGAVIKPQHGYNNTKGSFTVLTAAAAKGDKSITVKDASKWKTGKYFVAAFNAKQNKSDMPNFDIISGCVKIEKNTITLKNVLKKDYSAGTKVRQHRYGATYIYAKHGSVPTAWSTWKGEAVQGEMLRKAAYIRPMIIVNNKKDGSIVFNNLTVEEF